MDVVDVQGLGKTYPGGTEALRDVTFQVPRGEVFCLLGRNGAGKTTLLRILATQLRRTAGTATVLGHDVTAEPEAIRSRIAVVPQEARPQMMMSGYDHVRLMCRIRGLSKEAAEKRTRSLLEELELWDHRDKLAADLSGGLRQRILLCMALVGEPELVFLDEPTIGLDPLGRRKVWAMVRRLTKAGATVLLTTHYMDEAERLADRLAIVEKGRLVFLGTVEAAKARAGGGMRVVVERQGGNGEREVLEPKDDAEILAVVQKSLSQGLRVTLQPTSLEDAFIAIVGGSIEEDAA